MFKVFSQTPWSSARTLNFNKHPNTTNTCYFNITATYLFLLILQAIFGDDLQNKRLEGTDWSPLDIELTVYPQQGSSFGTKQIHARLNLQVKCSANYPNEIPHIELTKSKGLSSPQLAQLQQELDGLMNQLKGEVMIFNLVQHIQVTNIIFIRKQINYPL